MTTEESKALYDKTRAGENICPKCEKPKEMYYRPWCPRCDVPQMEQKSVINLIQCLRHLEVVHKREGLHDRIWKYLCNMDFINNDSYTTIMFPDLEDDKNKPELLEDFRLLKELVKDEDMLFRVGW